MIKIHTLHFLIALNLRCYSTYKNPAANKIPGIPVIIVSCRQSLIAYATPAKSMVKRKKPVHTKPPAKPL